MKLSEKEWFKYLMENKHKFVVWFVFLFVTLVLLFLTTRIIDGVSTDSKIHQRESVDEVKIYLQKSTPDSLLNVLKEEVDMIQNTLESMQQDSIAISVRKVSK